MDTQTGTMTRTDTAMQAAVPLALTALDRCDSCGSQAYVRVTLAGGSELLFCGHHANAHRPALIIAGAAFYDETDKLTIARESGFGA